MNQHTADYRVEDHGSVVLVRPLTEAATTWVAEHLTLESWQWLGGAFAVEPRYLSDLLDGLAEAGLAGENLHQQTPPAFPASALRAFNNRHED